MLISDEDRDKLKKETQEDRYKALYERNVGTSMEDKPGVWQVYVEGGEDTSDEQWISVEDELPGGDVNVLVSYKNGINVMSLDEYHNRWWYVGDENYINFNDVTHWMELPNPPKVE
jgi:hypothetical protein